MAESNKNSDQNQLSDHLINPSNPYFLHPGENPALVLVTPLLSDTNYQQWKHDMLVALETKNKEHFVLGKIPCPDSKDPLHEAWRRCNKMVMLWLTCSMTSDIKQYVMWMDTAAEIWKDLCDRFTHRDKFRIADLQEEVQQLKQDDLTVSHYYTRLRILWKELSMYRTILVCKCSITGSCGLIAKIQNERDDDCLIKFLRGLNDEFAQVRSQVMLMEPMPDMVHTFSLVLQQEREFGGSNSQESITLATINSDSTKTTFPNRGSFTNTRGGGRFGRANGRGNSKTTKFCTNSRKINHNIDACFQIYGFPPGYKNNKLPSNSTKPSANNAETGSTSVQDTSVPEETKSQNKFYFSRDEYQAHLAILQQPLTNNSFVNNAYQSTDNHPGIPSFQPRWILDSGATDHICPSKASFNTLTPIKPISIRLPNNQYSVASFTSTIYLNNLVLHKVLYVPDFTVHLISIPKLIANNDCIVVFCQDNCIIVQIPTF
ncbi:uncharacterized protein LOC109790981 [Cajanus cajan]|uniref:uncharacterized protein LOC109790981 n=1 Tax=Cajanus cajan TaxID=3821 RepID=UPI00098D8E4F|nr:uncharacterized protein LOC109790981 [Cajanus cajan]